MGVDRREKQTLIPAFDPEALARELEAASDRPTITPPFDASSYARRADDVVVGDDRYTPLTLPETTSGVQAAAMADAATSTLGRAMYGSYLSSDYPEALVLAERVLAREPEHALAQLVVEGCRDRIGAASGTRRLSPSSVVRLKRPFELVELVELGGVDPDPTSQVVLGHIDGVADVAMLAELSGIPRPEAMHRLHALLDLGVLELVS